MSKKNACLIVALFLALFCVAQGSFAGREGLAAQNERDEQDQVTGQAASGAELAASGAELAGFLSRVGERAAGAHKVACKFEQQRFLAIFTEPVIFHGRLVVSRPDKLRWENISPIPSVLIFSGDEGLRCNADAPSMRFDLRTDPVMKMVAEQIWTWADSAYEKLADQYAISLVEPFTLELAPLKGGLAETVEVIRVSFAPESYQPEQVVIEEKQGDKTVLRFYDYDLSPMIDDSLFSVCF